MTRAPHPSTLLAALVLLQAAPAPGAGDRLPYSLAVEVAHDPRSVSAGVREELERALLRELFEEGCFEQARRLEPGEARRDDLLLRVTLEDLLEESRYETPLAERASPNAEPEVRQRMVAVFSVAVRADLLALPEESPLRSRRFVQETRRRPVLPGEDARSLARTEAISEAARRARRVACRGSLLKLREKIEASRAPTPEPTPRAR